MVILYELSIKISTFIIKKQKKEAEKEAGKELVKK
jgi:Sec-independent protein secretion pathway component TatC